MPPPAKKRRVQSPLAESDEEEGWDDGLEEGELDNGEAALRRFRNAKEAGGKIQLFLDTMAEDSDDEDGDNDLEEQETLSDRGERKLLSLPFSL